MKQWIRPDGRCFVFGEPDDDLPPGRAHAGVDEADEARARALAGLGFASQRRELVLELPTDPAAWSVPAVETPSGIAFVPADRVEEEQLRLLDDLLRQDVPGTDGWKWSPAGFREETYESRDFDPATYLVALDERRSGVGIARVWMRPDRPRLGLIAVRPDWRRRGVARALLAAALTAVRERDPRDVRTDVDETNTASRSLLFGFGGRTMGASLELVREGGFRLRPSVPEDAEAIAAVQVRSAQAGFAHFRPPVALATLDPALRVPLWRERLPLVAEGAEGIVGLAHFGPSEAEKAGEIYRFFVAPECWGEGIGRALMASALEQLRVAGHSQAILWVHADNGRARRFYEAAGLRPDGAERDEEAFGEVVKELRYRIDLG
ncbi:MAG TPA: GNAT family N-acetyltransferase [Gaiellaceae bacterium]|jgi:GNAT superfamily N-acetyltransferase|nr:GNAT family N-acetyltransferase [Gaiellaceae bacterium]